MPNFQVDRGRGWADGIAKEREGRREERRVAGAAAAQTLEELPPPSFRRWWHEILDWLTADIRRVVNMRHTNKRQARPERDPKTAKLLERQRERERNTETAGQPDDLDCVAWTKTELGEWVKKWSWRGREHIWTRATTTRTMTVSTTTTATTTP